MKISDFQNFYKLNKIVWSTHGLARMQDLRKILKQGGNNMCKYCKNDRMINSFTTHVVNYKEYVIIIKNVPCLECSQCGEKYYSNDVALPLDRIVNDTKKSMQEISVIDYKKVA